MDTSHDIAGLSSASPVIRVRGLVKRYDHQEVIHGIDLDVRRGEILGYIGPNGAGKTTTVKIMIGMLPDFEGDVSVCGFDVRREPLEVKRRIGYVPETAALYEVLTPMEYLMFVGRLYGLADDCIAERSRKLLTLLDLEKETGNRISTFSKGMRQKVLLVGGLLHNPEVIFLDEPLTGLDANSTLVVKELIRGLSQAGVTIFYCSHLMDVVERVSDRIVIIDQGRVVADGSFEELSARCHETSLERIFTDLTHAGGHEAIARQMIEIMSGASQGKVSRTTS